MGDSADRRLPPGISPSGRTVGTLRHFHCERCRHVNEVMFREMVPADYFNAVANYCRAHANSDEFVLLGAATLNAMGEDRKRLAERVRELEATIQLKEEGHGP